MSLGAAHASSSALFVLGRPEGFERLEDLVVVVGIMFFKRLAGGEEKFNEKSFEQSGTDVSVGLIVEFSAGVDSLDLRLKRKAENGLDIV